MLKFILLIIVGFLWGSQYIFVKVALQENLDPTALTLFRIGIGTIFLVIVCLFMPRGSHDQSTTDRSPWWMFLIIGILEAALPALLIAWGELELDSSLAAILLGTTPLFTIILSCFILRAERSSPGLILAILVGFAGLLVLFGFRMQFDQKIHWISSIAVLLAAASFAASLVLLAKVKGHPPQHVARNLMFWGTIALLPVWLIFGNPSDVTITWISAGSVIYLGILGSSVVFLIYVQLIRIAGATFASLSNYLVPVVGVALGISLGQEHILVTDMIALAIIMGALFAANPECIQRLCKRQGTLKSKE
ncbi:MAG: EamA family transporter [Phycisphaerales bacterium]|nr:EamA family transporter [Phycisphaerales bacterium]